MQDDTELNIQEIYSMRKIKNLLISEATFNNAISDNCFDFFLRTSIMNTSL